MGFVFIGIFAETNYCTEAHQESRKVSQRFCGSFFYFVNLCETKAYEIIYNRNFYRCW